MQERFLGLHSEPAEKSELMSEPSLARLLGNKVMKDELLACWSPLPHPDPKSQSISIRDLEGERPHRQKVVKSYFFVEIFLSINSFLTWLSGKLSCFSWTLSQLQMVWSTPCHLSS